MKMIITGALGHIGSSLIRKIPEAFPGVELTLIDNLLTQRYVSLFNLSLGGKRIFFEEDILKMDLRSVFRTADVVVHLAAITDAANSFKNKDKVEEVNLQGAIRVAEACTREGCAMIFISTTSVYGTQESVVDEECSLHDLKPQSPYAESKLKAEQMIQLMCQKEKLKAVIFRFGTIFGISPGMRFHTAINKFCWQAVMKRPITVWRTALRQVRPYLDLKDGVEAILFAIRESLFDGRVYNVVTCNTTVEEILDQIRIHVPQLHVEYVNTQIMNQLSYHVLGDRLRKVGFQCSGDLKSGIFDTISLIR